MIPTLITSQYADVAESAAMATTPINPNFTPIWNPPAVLVMSASEHFEVFALLPLGDFRLESLDFRVLDVDVVVDELSAQRFAEEGIVPERKHRLTQRGRQKARLRLVGRIGRRSRIERPVDSVQTREELRGHVKVRIGRRLSYPVLEPGCRIAGTAEHPDHDAPVVATPDGPVRRERIGAVSLVSVDHWRGEHGRRPRMLQQSRHVGLAQV